MTRASLTPLGLTAAATWASSPTVRTVAEAEMSTLDGDGLTIMVTVAFALALAQLVTVIEALPAFLAVTTPVAETLATAGALDLKIVFLLEGTFGVNVAVTLVVLPMPSVVAAALAVSFFTCLYFLAETTETTTFLVATLDPDFALTTMVALPGLSPLMTPLLVTLATLGFELT